MSSLDNFEYFSKTWLAMLLILKRSFEHILHFDLFHSLLLTEIWISRYPKNHWSICFRLLCCKHSLTRQFWCTCQSQLLYYLKCQLLTNLLYDQAVVFPLESSLCRFLLDQRTLFLETWFLSFSNCSQSLFVIIDCPQWFSNLIKKFLMSIQCFHEQFDHKLIWKYVWNHICIWKSLVHLICDTSQHDLQWQF